LRFGSLKDLILGVSLVRADGVAARAGGKVVKNVAGFDLSKLVVGSYGTLALVTTATLRVHPLPEASAALRIAQLQPPIVWEIVSALRERQLEPVAINALRGSGEPPYYDLDIIFEGFRSGVEAQVASVFALANERGWSAAQLEPDAAQAADTEVRAAGPLRVRYTTLPSQFAASDERAIEPLAQTLVRSVANAYPALGVFTLAGTPTPATPAALALARERIERTGGSLLVEAQPAEAHGSPAIEPWGTPPPSFALMQQLKARFDPDRRLAAGRFVGGL
jgi:glycolate oxidase FAD binding subunit